MMDGYQTYQAYLAIKAHFTTDSFDATRYGKTKANYNSFEKRNDKSFFNYIAKRFTDQEIKPFFISNMIKGDQYIIDLADDLDESIKTFHGWKKRMGRLKYLFENDCKNIKSFMDEKGVSFDETFNANKKKYPIVMRLMMENHISLETYVVLEKVFNLSKQYNKTYLDDHIYDSYALRVRKYCSYFKMVDVKEYKGILKDIFKP